MLVLALEEYDEETGTAKKAAIMPQDVVGKQRPSPTSTAPRKGCWFPSTARAALTLPFIAELYGKPEATDHRRARAI